jgi:uncharacterized protein YdhG (YjbR/CyaY superfamily)
MSNPTVKSGVPENVDAYLATIPQDQRKALESLRKAIKAAAPQAEEVISYRIPTYRYHGPLVHFVAREKYGSFIVASQPVVESFQRELEGFKTSGTTIHFTPKKPLPASLVKKIVKARMKENEAAHARKGWPKI